MGGFQCLFFAFLGNSQKLLEPHTVILLKPGPSACLCTSWVCRKLPGLECLPPLSPTRKPFFITSVCGGGSGKLPGADSVFNGSSLVPWIPTQQSPDSGCPLAQPPLEIHCWFWDTLISSSQFHDQNLSVSESPCWRAGVPGSLPGK